MFSKLLGIPVALAALAVTVMAADPEKKPAEVKGAKNLVPNGDFEEGDGTPKGWQTIDGLTTFWVKDEDPKRGKVLKFDTDVLQSQGYDWWVKIATKKGKAKDAPKKEATKEPKYDTLAGNDGVWFWSDPFPIEKDKAYWLTLDVKGPGLMVWLMGYPEKPDTSFGADEGAFVEVLKEKVSGKPAEKGRDHEGFIHKYVWKGQLAAGGSNEWKTYSRRKQPFRPTSVTPNVKWGRILILPTWPPGEYFVDNVRLVEVEDKGEK
ncbi:MAG TPA: hypothetical protein VKA46_27045 [Gemmataceae bacterium]|nr:hypothetical protein [Gemmataceae bacterium]